MLLEATQTQERCEAFRTYRHDAKEKRFCSADSCDLHGLDACILWCSSAGGFTAGEIGSAIPGQRGSATAGRFAIWGTTEAEANVTVDFKGQRKTTTAQKDGSWRVVLVRCRPNASRASTMLR